MNQSKVISIKLIAPALASSMVLSRLLDVPLFWVQLRAVTGQVKKLDPIFPLSYPRLDQFAVVHAQVVQDQEDFFARIFDQSL